MSRLDEQYIDLAVVNRIAKQLGIVPLRDHRGVPLVTIYEIVDAGLEQMRERIAKYADGRTGVVTAGEIRNLPLRVKDE